MKSEARPVYSAEEFLARYKLWIKRTEELTNKFDEEKIIEKIKDPY